MHAEIRKNVESALQDHSFISGTHNLSMMVSSLKFLGLSAIALSAVTVNAFVAPQCKSFVARQSLPSASSVFDARNVVSRNNRAGSTSMRE